MSGTTSGVKWVTDATVPHWKTLRERTFKHQGVKIRWTNPTEQKAELVNNDGSKYNAED